MFYRINEIKLKPKEPQENIPKHIIKKLGSQGRGLTIDEYRIIKESIDARDKDNIRRVYTVDFTINQKGRQLNLPKVTPEVYEYTKEGSRPLKNRPVICGFGPSGMFAALILARQGYNPIVLERGSEVNKRVKDVEKFWEKGILDEESNVQFGEGGAGTFSDGKLTTNIKDKRIAFVLRELVAAGADPAILYKQKPHIGTDILRKVVVNIREEIKSLGGTILFDTRLEKINISESKLASIVISSKNQPEKEIRGLFTELKENNKEKERYRLLYPAEALVLAIGHSARDTMHELYEKGVEIQQKPFSIGFRIEHLQEVIDKAQYGCLGEEIGLPPAEYKLSHHCKNGRGVYSFCMCPGGEIVMSASEKCTVVTNGMSYSKRDGKYANSAILTDVRTEDFQSNHALAGIKFQEKYEKLAFRLAGGDYKAPECTYGQFKNAEKEAYALRNSLPEFVIESVIEAMTAFGKKICGFDDESARLVGVETRSSSPIKIPRNEEGECNIGGIYPTGEGASYAGGIMSAAVDGMKMAEKIIEKYSKKEINI